MPLSTRISHTRLRVRYAETDASGITHHSAYVPWLEAGRVDWLRSSARETCSEVACLTP